MIIVYLLQYPSPTILCATLADEDLALHTAHLVVVVPGQLGARSNVVHGEEGDPGEAQVVRIHEHVLHEQVGRTRVLKEGEKSV